MTNSDVLTSRKQWKNLKTKYKKEKKSKRKRIREKNKDHLWKCSFWNPWNQTFPCRTQHYKPCPAPIREASLCFQHGSSVELCDYHYAKPSFMGRRELATREGRREEGKRTQQKNKSILFTLSG